MSDSTLAGELDARDLSCQWCGEVITRFYVESGDSHLPDVEEEFVCKDCGNETIVKHIKVQMTLVAVKARTKQQVDFEHDARQSKMRDRVIELRRTWGGIKGKFSLYCKVAGHTWTIVARARYNETRRSTGKETQNTMAYCRVCDTRHDDLSGDIMWVSGCETD